MSVKKKKTETKRLVILDTHAILHRAYHALPEFSSSRGEPTGALYGLVSMLLKIVADLQPDYIVAAFDLPTPTYRHIAFKEYKAQRAKTDDALVAQIMRSREVLAALGVDLFECEGFEADDVIGTIVEEMKREEGIECVVASGDMDTLQLVDGDRAKVYTLRKGLNDTILYNEDAVIARFGFPPTLIPDYKGLRGDPSDNIPGIKGVGEKTAGTLIGAFGSLENVYTAIKKTPEKVEALGIKGVTLQKLRDGEEDAKFSKMLAEIRRDAPIDFKLPAPWREHVSPKTALDMLQVFEFRSLIPRVKAALMIDSAFIAQKSGDFSEENLASPDAQRPDEEIQGPFRKKDFPAFSSGELFSELPVGVSEEEIQKIGIAAWVLDSNATQPTLDDIYRIGRSDTFAEAKENILADITKNELSFVYDKIELPLYPVLRGMEKHGVRIDTAFLADLSKKYKKDLGEIAKRIYEAAGGEFNVNSPKQLGEVLFDQLGLEVKNQKKTATGARSTRESELEKLREAHPIIGDILSYRELQKLLSTYIDTIPTLIGSDGRLHTSYVQTGTTTGRLASLNPNLQNIPIKTELGRAIRHGFVAAEGMQLLSFDYSQIELRVAAFLSGDEGLTNIFKEDRDVHREVAARVFAVDPTDVTYEQRRRAKVINFGILYGMGVNSLRASLGTSRTDAQEFYNQYFATFPRLAAYLDETKATAAKQGYTETFFGRRRYFEGIKSPIPFVRASAERMAINAPIQGTQADVVKLAMVAIGRWIEEESLEDDVHLILQVHDELVFEIREGKEAQCAPKIKQLMEEVMSDKERHGIPFKTEGKIGKNWGDMQELSL